MFKQCGGDWIEFRKMPELMEVGFHWSSHEPKGAYWQNMQAVWEATLKSLIDAQQAGKRYVLFRHGHSTSRIGRTTSRSQVRKLMRSKEATPFIIRRECIQHGSVFVAAIRPLPMGG